MLALDGRNRSRRELDWPAVLGGPRLELVKFDAQRVVLAEIVEVGGFLEAARASLHLEHTIVWLYARVVVGTERHPALIPWCLVRGDSLGSAGAVSCQA